jgi:membrane protease YdiL (CAAX protease family)
MLKLPEALSGIEEWMRKTEDSAELITNLFLNVNGVGALLINIFMIAVIPAVGEEFLFRGVLQKQFKLWFGNIHVAIFVAAFLFSAMHMQFFGFIPRLVLGLILGYLYYFSKNLWIPIIVHFFNNAIAVIIYYLNHNKIISSDIDKLGSNTEEYFLIIGSFIFTVILLLSIYKREAFRKSYKIKKED